MPHLYKHLFFINLLMLSGLWSFSQTSTSSPYSIYGIGDPESQGFAEHAAMGDVKYGLAQRIFINPANPASFSMIGKPVFKTGIAVNFISLHADTSVYDNQNAYVRNFSFGFPVIRKKNRWSTAFGLMPWTKMGYSIEDVDTVQNFGAVQYMYKGSGEINRLYLGHAVTLLNHLTDTAGIRLALGLNASYLFGSVLKTRRVIPQNVQGSFNTLISNSTHVGDFSFDFGLLYTQRIRSGLMFSLGGSFNLPDSLKTTNIVLARSYTGQTHFETFKDTIQYDTSGFRLYNPLAYGFGLGIYIGKRWVIAFDYSAKDWSQFAYFGQNVGLTSCNQYAMGIQMQPDNEAVTKIFRLMRYRMGFRYANTHLLIKGKHLKEYGISFGFGLPLIKSQSPGTGIHFAMEIGQRGENKEGLIAEQFVNLKFGFTFTPHKFDRWFYRRKIK